MTGREKVVGQSCVYVYIYIYIIAFIFHNTDFFFISINNKQDSKQKSDLENQPCLEIYIYIYLKKNTSNECDVKVLWTFLLTLK